MKEHILYVRHEDVEQFQLIISNFECSEFQILPFLFGNMWLSQSWARYKLNLSDDELLLIKLSLNDVRIKSSNA